MLFDDETAHGDFSECWQIWYHKYKCSKEGLKEVFGNSPVVEFILPDCPFLPAGWVRFVRGFRDHLD